MEPHYRDAIHNLMSALDSLATALISRNGPPPEDVLKETYFPIHWGKDGLDKPKTAKFFKRCPDAEKYIRRLQPYRHGKGDVLFQIRQLDIMDKHRRIITANTGLFQVQTPTPDGGVQVHHRKLPNLRDGDELFRVGFFEPHFDDQTHFTFEVTFGQDSLVCAGEPALARLISSSISWSVSS